MTGLPAALMTDLDMRKPTQSTASMSENIILTLKTATGSSMRKINVLQDTAERVLDTGPDRHRTPIDQTSNAKGYTPILLSAKSLSVNAVLMNESLEPGMKLRSKGCKS